MKRRYTLDKAFGPVGSVAGLILLVAGAFASFTSLYGLLFAALGAFMGFSSTGTTVDVDKKRVKHSNNLFGVIRLGTWIPVDREMQLDIRRFRRGWRTYSMSNQSVDVDGPDFRLVLCDAEGAEVAPIAKFADLETARARCGELGMLLNVECNC